jgi:PKD repeat protein
MKKWVLVFFMVIVMVSVSIGCSSSKSVNDGENYPQITSTMAAPAPMPAPAIPRVTVPAATGYSSAGGNSTPTSVSSQGLSAIDRMVIRTGNIQLVVKDITATMDNIVKIAADNGGYVIGSQQWKENERNLGSISIRVLAENYNKTMAALRTLAVSVTLESTSSQDVTEEYTDLTSKLRNLAATEAQLLKIMENATKTEDVLAVQRELTTVRGDIEQTKGRMLFIERTTSTSLINVTLNESVFGLKFSADKVRVYTNETVTFLPEVTGGFEPFNYQWYFGDGDTSIEKSPRHAYKNGGIYSVSLIVTDDKGYVNQMSRNDYIVVQSSWNAGSVAGAAWSALKVFAKVVANVLIWIITFAPVWIVIGAIVWFVLFLKKRNSRKAAEKKSQHQDNIK